MGKEMRYKLIKPYPDSPDLGQIVKKIKYEGELAEWWPNSMVYVADGIMPNIEISQQGVENYPEFWQPENEWNNE